MKAAPRQSGFDGRQAHLTIAAIWLGMLVGVSFIATPVKFGAAGLDLAVALDIGRLTFGLFSRIEWGLAALTLLVAFAAPVAPWRRALAVTLALGVAMQALWLLPALNARVIAIASGQSLAPSADHALYAGIEAGKAAMLGLICMAGSLWRRNNG